MAHPMKTHMILQRFLPGLLLMLLAMPGHADLKIKTSQANLRTGPAVTFAVTGVVTPSESLKVTAYQADYVQIKRGNGVAGWIHAPSQGWKKSDILAALAANKPQDLASPSTPVVSSITNVVPKPVASVAPAASPYAASQFTMSLADIGQRQGHFFEGAYGVHSKDFFFPLPQGASLRQGNLRVHFRASPQLNASSSLRLDINGKPTRLISLENREQAGFVDIPLDQEALQHDSLRLTIKAVLSNAENRCLDERRLALNFVHILPQTAVVLDLNPATNLAAAWTSLPSHVRIGIPQTINPSVTAALLQTAIWLRNTGHQVSFSPYPQRADVQIGTEKELTRRFPGVINQGAESEGALALTRDADGKPLILITDRVLAKSLSSQPLPWIALLRGSQYRFGKTTLPSKNSNAVDLIAAGLGETQYVSRNIEWGLDLSAPLVEADKRLKQLVLNVVAAPQPVHGQQLLQVFLNGMLQEVRPLERDGKPHTLHFDLGSSAQRTGINQLRIAVQRTDEQGDCRDDLAAFPVQLLPGSRLELANSDTDLASFNDLRAHFAKGMNIYMTPDSQVNLARELQMAAAIFSNLGLNIEEDRLSFLKPGEAFAPKQPFVLIGRGVTPKTAAVRLDRGRVQVLDGANQPVLALDRLPGIGLAQLAAQDGVQGLVIMAPVGGASPPADQLHLDRDNVAFITDHGIALTLDSREPALSKVAYPDYGGWRDWFAQHRFWLIAIGWMVIGAAMVALYRKSRRHGKN